MYELVFLLYTILEIDIIMMIFNLKIALIFEKCASLKIEKYFSNFD